MKLGPLFAVGSCLLAVLACSSDTTELKPVNRADIAQQICEFKRAVPNSITAIQTISGSIIYGSASNEAIATMPSIWSSAYATRSGLITTDDSGPGFCCKWNGPMFFCGHYDECTREQKHDVSALFGIGRAQSRRDAERLASDNCEQIVEQYKEANDISSSRLVCERLVTQQCY